MTSRLIPVNQVALAPSLIPMPSDKGTDPIADLRKVSDVTCVKAGIVDRPYSEGASMRSRGDTRFHDRHPGPSGVEVFQNRMAWYRREEVT